MSTDTGTVLVADLDQTGRGVLSVDGITVTTINASSLEAACEAARWAAMDVADGSGYELRIIEHSSVTDPDRRPRRNEGRAIERSAASAPSRVPEDTSRTRPPPSTSRGAPGGHLGPGMRGETPAGHALSATPGKVPIECAAGSPRSLNLGDVSQARTETSTKWYRRILGLGPTDHELAHRRRVQRLQQPLAGHTFVGMSCQIKGGDGKTTDAILTGQALAENTGHQVVVISADPANGNLAERLYNFPTEEEMLAHPTTIDLYQAEMAARDNGAIGLTDTHKINSHLLLAGRLRACGARQIIEDPSNDDQDTGLTAHQLTVLIECLSRVADIIIIDCGTSRSTAAFKTALSRADGLMLVGNPRWDVLSKAHQSLKFIASRRPGILDRAVLALSHTDQNHANQHRAGKQRSHQESERTFDLEKTLDQLCESIPAGLVRINYDPHISNGTAIQWGRLSAETQNAALDLAGAMADLFPHVTESR